jgi:hypothetical protein
VNRIRLSRTKIFPFVLRHPVRSTATALFLAAPAYAQQGGDPWDNAVNVNEMLPLNPLRLTITYFRGDQAFRE